VADDVRGRFVKFFHAPTYEACGLRHDFAEAFCTTSRSRVLRGMHFQVPPRAHAKLVWCVAGRMLDVLLDLRRGSSTFGEHIVLELNESVPRGIYIPPGIAHGFYTLDEPGVLTYLVTSAHSAHHDRGIRWDSFGMTWPDAEPIVSKRDAALPGVNEFASPFGLADDL
jgi:dTDP-4-dehydrorhamnose 3,5-epimerase